jgi:NAD(P)-dependent dehydrogenase (short-subunit alcohol dehydrogenase family)
MGSALRGKTVLIIGRGSGIARAVTLLARSEGARVVVAGRDRTTLADAYADLGDSGISAETIDITDDASIAALADRVGSVDHVVSTASARARGNLADLQRENLRMSFDTKVIGPTMLAKYFAGQINPGDRSSCSPVACFQTQRRLSRRRHHQWRRRLPHPLARG